VGIRGTKPVVFGVRNPGQWRVERVPLFSCPFTRNSWTNITRVWPNPTVSEQTELHPGRTTTDQRANGKTENAHHATEKR